MLIWSISFWIIITSVKPEHRKHFVTHNINIFYKNVTKMNRNVYQSLILLYDLISVWIYSYMPIPLSVCVCVCVCVCVWDASILHSWCFKCNPSLLSTFTALYLDCCFYLTYLPCYSHTILHRCVCVCVCWFCTLDVLEFHPIIVVYFFLHCGRFVDCTHRNYLNYLQFCEFVCFCRFPIVGHFWRRQVWLFSYDHLACSNHTLKFVFVFTFQMP